MAKVINIVGKKSNVGKTILMEGLIKELKSRGHKIATIKHDVHGFDIDHEGKDTYRHRQAGSETVIISSATRFALIKELKEETKLMDLLQMVKDKDIILVEGYKKSSLRKIEVIREDLSEQVISSPDLLIAVASNTLLPLKGIKVVEKDNYTGLANLIELEDDFEFEKN